MRQTFEGALLGRLVQDGLTAAAVEGLRWLQDGALPSSTDPDAVFECAAPVKARSATKSHELDAVLYVDGVALAVIIAGERLESVQQRAEQLEESCPAWFVSPVLLVAVTWDECAITMPGMEGDGRWRGVSLDALRTLLEPRALVRFALHDCHVQERLSPPRRRFVLPNTVRAVELAFARACEPAHGLVSIAEGAGPFAAVRSLVGRLVEVGMQAIVITPDKDLAMRDQLARDLQDFKPCMDILGLHHRPVMLLRPGPLASLLDEVELEPRPRVVIAVGADAGFRGEHGFEVRLLMPEAPWISITMLSPWSITPAVLHAFANPRDEDGLLAVVDVAEGRVPVRQHIEELPWARRAQADLLASSMFMLGEVIFANLPKNPRATSLVLVSSNYEASELTQILAKRGIPTYDATDWGRPNEGWRQLANPERSLVVVRTSWPFWAPVPQLHAAFVARNVGVATLGRLRNALGRRAENKTEALLYLFGEYLSQPTLTALREQERR